MAYGNGGLQPGTDEPVMFAYCPEGVGGNQTLLNSDEDDILDATIDKTPTRTGDLSSEDDSHVQGVYRMMSSDFAGS